MGENTFISLNQFNNHRPVLAACLPLVTGTIIEFGMGEGSTQMLHDYCKKNNIRLISFENNPEWFEKFSHLKGSNHSMYFIDDWKKLKQIEPDVGLVFIDHAPAEQRHNDAIKYKKAQIVIVHDTEHEGMDYDVYKIADIAKHFKYRFDFKIPNHPSKTTAFSNYIDISNLTLPKFTAI